MISLKPSTNQHEKHQQKILIQFCLAKSMQILNSDILNSIYYVRWKGNAYSFFIYDDQIFTCYICLITNSNIEKKSLYVIQERFKTFLIPYL